MAQISFKHAQVFIKDGTRTSDTNGRVNNAGGYAVGTTVITVDGLTSAATAGQYVEFAGDPVTHIISSVTDDASSNTTEITIANGLTKAILDDAIVYLRSSNELEITIGEGNVTWSEQRNIEYTLDRGNIDEVREGDDIPMDVNIDAVWEYITGSSSSGANPTIKEALTKTGNASSWVSSDPDQCRPYAVDIAILYQPDCTTNDQEEIILPDFRWENHDYDLSDGTFSISGRCNATEALAYRSAQS